MMKARPSREDSLYRQAFEDGAIPPAMFNHRAHLRLAYVYLCEGSAAEATDKMRSAIQDFLRSNSVDQSKYHETLTASWIHAVRHFIELAPTVGSFAELLEVDGRLLDKSIMLTHYTAERLFSDDARAHFLAPDLQPIPTH